MAHRAKSGEMDRSRSRFANFEDNLEEGKGGGGVAKTGSTRQDVLEENL